jgi:hypothetical protein
VFPSTPRLSSILEVHQSRHGQFTVFARSSFPCCHRPTVPGARSFVALTHPQRSLILGARPFPALTPPVFARHRPSPVLGLRSFPALARPAFARPWRLPILAVHSYSALPVLARPTFARPRHSPVLGVHSFAALARFQRLLVWHSVAPSACPSSVFTRARRSQCSIIQRRSPTEFASPRRALILGAQSFPALARPAFARPWRMAVLGVHSFSALPVLARPAFARPRRSSVLGVHSFSALGRFPLLRIQCSLVPGHRPASTGCRRPPSPQASCCSQRPLVILE